MNLICLRHPSFNGQTSPVLSCKTCCSIFIAAVKAQNHDKVTDESQWLEEKRQEVKQAISARIDRTRIKAHVNDSRIGFHPSTI